MSFHFLHDMSKGFMRRNHCDLFCSCVESCAFVGSWTWIELQFATSLLHLCFV